MTLWKPNTERPKPHKYICYVCGDTNFPNHAQLLKINECENWAELAKNAKVIRWCYLDDLIASEERQAQMLDIAK